MIMKNEIFRAFLPYVFFFAGVILWWPLALLSILTAALERHFIAAVLHALIHDVLYGAPTRALYRLQMPFTFFALFCIAAHMFIRSYVLARDRRVL